VAETSRQGHDGAPVNACKEVASFCGNAGWYRGINARPGLLAGTGIIFLEVETHDKENTNMQRLALC
jgi:hypothetical protein